MQRHPPRHLRLFRQARQRRNNLFLESCSIPGPTVLLFTLQRRRMLYILVIDASMARPMRQKTGFQVDGSGIYGWLGAGGERVFFSIFSLRPRGGPQETNRPCLREQVSQNGGGGGDSYLLGE